ncbi:MAG TPA: hypothetical protein VGO93_05465 [Candidatus Xenobia bacterium]
MKQTSWALGLLMTAAVVAQTALGAKVVHLAQADLGQQIGDGECTTLVDQVLRGAGARGLGSYGGYGPDTDYVWGTPIQLKDVQPGDVIQFRNYHMTRRIQHADGSASNKTADAPHHTGIVQTNDGNGQITIIEQSVGTPVQTNSLGFASGTFNTHGDTITCTVTGQLWYYRPIAR